MTRTRKRTGLSIISLFQRQAKRTIAPVLFALSYSIAHAEVRYSPNDVYAELEYCNDLVSQLLQTQGSAGLTQPESKETAVKPMHVYELHVSILQELKQYALANQHRPPPIVVSQPVRYTPTDVFYLSTLISKKIEDIYTLKLGESGVIKNKYKNKQPTDAYQQAFTLFYLLNRLNGKEKISPDIVFSHISRAKADLQNSVLELAKRIDKQDENKKRMLVTSLYGLHPDGSTLPVKPSDKTPADVFEKTLSIRSKLNILRQTYSLPSITIPAQSQFSGIKPIDVFLQTQFIIAELNLLKQPWNIHSTTNTAKEVQGKTPSDVYYEMTHIEYMLDRLIKVLG